MSDFRWPAPVGAGHQHIYPYTDGEPMNLVSWTVDRQVPEGRVRAGFTSRLGGVSASPFASLNLGFHVGDHAESVHQNRQLLALEIGALPGWMDQVHGTCIGQARPAETLERTDGLILAEPHLVPAHAPSTEAACVMVADCVPLLLVRSDAPAAAAVHVGRAGFMGGIVGVAISKLGRPERVTAIIGPSICGNCYEVPEPMREESRRIEEAAASNTSWGTPSIDIPAGIHAQLSSLGVADVINTGICTRESPDFFSYRRASQTANKTGRFIGIVQVFRDTPS